MQRAQVCRSSQHGGGCPPGEAGPGRFETKERGPHSTRTRLAGQGRASGHTAGGQRMTPECVDEELHETEASRTELDPSASQRTRRDSGTLQRGPRDQTAVQAQTRQRTGPVLNILELPQPQPPGSCRAQLVFGRQPRPEGPWQGHVQPPGLPATHPLGDLPPGRQAHWGLPSAQALQCHQLRKAPEPAVTPGEDAGKERDSLNEPALSSQGPRARDLGHEGTLRDQCGSPHPAQSRRLSTLTRKARKGPCHSSGHTPAGAPGAVGV